MKRAPYALVVVLVLLTGCGPSLPDPVEIDSPEGVLDLRAWNFAAGGPVVPQQWLWDADVLWNPVGGRPEGLPEALVRGAPERGGTLVESLAKRKSPHEAVHATASLRILVADRQTYALQVGALPGSVRVWVNGVLVWSSNVGMGTLVALQPHDARLDLVVEVTTADFLVLHSELNRAWILGPAQPLLSAERSERMTRSFQAMFLLVGAVLFWGLALLRPDRRTLVPFVLYLAVCLSKLLFNVEQSEPFLAPLFPDLSPSLYLFLNHGLNLLPFPFFVLFLARQFPHEVSRLSVLVTVVATVVVTLWELLPFTLLAMGLPEAYSFVMGTPWALVLNLYVVLVVLFIFERIYHAWKLKRPLSRALFVGGLTIGLIVLLPIPLSYFLPTKYTYFLGWGLILFLFVLGFELIRLQVLTTEAQVKRLVERLERRESLTKFLAPGWGPRLGKPQSELLVAGDRKSADVIVLQVRSPDDGEHWLAEVGNTAQGRQALLVEWRDGTGLWVMDSWPEAALALALEAQGALTRTHGLRYRIVATKATVEFRVRDAGAVWLPEASGLPRARLAELDALAEAYGASLVVDAALKDGLVIGGWRRHRHLTPSCQEVELYEGEEESLAQIKDKTLDLFETALAHSREGRTSEAVEAMVAVVRQNPFDQAARVLLADWSPRRW